MTEENSPEPAKDKAHRPGDEKSKRSKHDLRPSYAEGLQAINSSDLPAELRDALQLDHSNEYMERKFREWQQQEEQERSGALEGSEINENGTPGSTPRQSPSRPDKESFPYRGIEFSHLSKCAQASSKVWKNAYLSYPKLREGLSLKDASVLMKALVLNEIQYYAPKQIKRDAEARERTPGAQSLEPLGYAQMTPKSVRDLEEGLVGGKKVRAELTQLSYYFSTRGHTGEGHEARALLDPTCVPMIVAAKIETLLDAYEKVLDKFSNKPMRVDMETLAYGFKPDVFWNPKDIGDPNFHAVASAEQALTERIKGFELLFPCSQKLALTQSIHLASVAKWVIRLNEPIS
ncbi:hypothetical protein KF728_18110 [Candidatus Obscuribacterales bacterium]|nr:hypothetical protein [Candidatus Obscuribacterales bacterium]